MNPSTNESLSWSYAKKFFLLFLISYLLLYMFPFPLSNIPYIGNITMYYSNVIDAITLWFGKHILKISTFTQIEMTGSGDTTFDYVKIISNLSIALFLSVLVTACFHKRINFHTLYAYTIIYVRYYVGIYLISYGVAKILPEGQFAFPGANRLEEKFGDASPMGLLWTFMGYSKAYCIFGGIGELLGGLLLLFRRTIVIGCLISLAVMINVMMLNFCYDVPVKLFSTHLVLFIFIILAPFLRSMYSFFINQKAVTLIHTPLILPHKWQRISRVVCKVLLLGVFIAPQFIGMIFQSDDEPSPTKKFDGAYSIHSFTVKDSTKTPLADTIKWSKVNIQYDYANIIGADESSSYYEIKTDSLKNNLTFTSNSDSTKVYTFEYSNLSDTTLDLRGKLSNQPIEMKLTKRRLSDYSLVKRKFHWINEYPPNW